MGKNDMPVRQLHTKHRVGESLPDYALHFDRFFFSHRYSYTKNDQILIRIRGTSPLLHPVLW